MKKPETLEDFKAGDLVIFNEIAKGTHFADDKIHKIIAINKSRGFLTIYPSGGSFTNEFHFHYMSLLPSLKFERYYNEWVQNW
jgi:hypothetical protein